MTEIYCREGSIVNNLGSSINEQWKNCVNDQTLLTSLNEEGRFGYAQIIGTQKWQSLRQKHGTDWTKCALLCIEALENCNFSLYLSEDPIIYLATTKGDIDLLDPDNSHDPNASYLLGNIAYQIKKFYDFDIEVHIVSNACISGNQAILLSYAELKTGRKKHAFALGVDLFTQFTFSGFKSFMAISKMACKPFDRDREGISLGESAACLHLSVDREPSQIQIVISGGAITNDANHISGPSRNGEGLYRAFEICKTLTNSRPDVISLHGTATRYNDDMESIAVQRSGWSQIPVFGLKGIYGHTLGAAGVLECLILIESMKESKIPGTYGCEIPGTTAPLLIDNKANEIQINCALKSTSGFGGNNAVLVFNKIVL